MKPHVRIGVQAAYFPFPRSLEFCTMHREYLSFFQSCNQRSSALPPEGLLTGVINIDHLSARAACFC
jgi:hypothetical protein